MEWLRWFNDYTKAHPPWTLELQSVCPVDYKELSRRMMLAWINMGKFYENTPKIIKKHNPTVSIQKYYMSPVLECAHASQYIDGLLNSRESEIRFERNHGVKFQAHDSIP